MAAVAVAFVEYLDRRYGGSLKLSELRQYQRLNYNGEIYTKEQVSALIERGDYHPSQPLMTVSDEYIQRALKDTYEKHCRGEEDRDFCEPDPDARLVEVDIPIQVKEAE